MAARRIFFTSSSPQKVCDPVSFKEEYGEDFDPVMKMAKNCTRLGIGRINAISASSAKHMIPLKMSLASVSDRNLVVFDELTN